MTSTREVKHNDSWHIPTEDGTDFGVLVRCGPPEHPYWWLLCPATATLYIGPNFDLTDCSDVECLWGDVHDAADRLRKWLDVPESTRRVLKCPCPTCGVKAGEMCKWTKHTTPAVDIVAANADGSYHYTRYCASIGDARGAMG